MEEDRHVVEKICVNNLETVLNNLISAYNSGSTLEEEYLNGPEWKFKPPFTLYHFMHGRVAEEFKQALTINEDADCCGRYEHSYTKALLDRFNMFHVKGAFLIEDKKSGAKSLYMHIFVRDTDKSYDDLANFPTITTERITSILHDMLKRKQIKFEEELGYLGEVKTNHYDTEVQDNYSISISKGDGEGLHWWTPRLKEDDSVYSAFILSQDTSFDDLVHVVKDLITILKED